MVWKIKRKSKEIQCPSCSPPRDTNTVPLKSCLRHTNTVPLKSCLKRNSVGVVSGQDTSLRSGSSSGHTNVLNISSSGRSSGIGSSGHSGSSSRFQQSLDSERHSKLSGTSGSDSSSWRKAVRFYLIYIREYERTLGDNPSCSSGPPVGIGWGYGPTRVVTVNQYECDNPYRCSQEEMVLPKEERVAILQEWTVSHDEMVQATRDNLKAKFQRRRTVRNARKVEKLEAAFEGAAKTLKRALHLKKRPSDEVKDLQDEAHRASEALDAVRVAEYHDFRLPEPDDGPVGISEPGDEDDSLQKLAAASSSPRKSMSGANRSVSVSVDETATAVSGITLESTNSSEKEMEQFYRELELEMFGLENPELSASSPIPTTLEVPDWTKSEDTIHSAGVTEVSSSESSVPSFSSFVSSTEDERLCHYLQMGCSPTLPQLPQQVPPSFQDARLMYSPNHRLQYNPYTRTAAYRGYSLRDAYRNNQCSAFNMANRMVPLSDMYASEREQQKEQSFPSHNPLLPRDDQLNVRSSGDMNDGPRIKHLPYSTAHTTESRWVEDLDHHGPVTITEDRIYYDSGPELVYPVPPPMW
eukprot:scaffold1525_cov142-Cylindrotheca_fusiformis.AAC.20